MDRKTTVIVALVVALVALVVVVRTRWVRALVVTLMLLWLVLWRFGAVN
jgi:hypothetical protein